MPVKSSDLHPAIAAPYKQKVINDLKIGTNVVTSQAKNWGCGGAIAILILGIVLCSYNGWLGFAIIMFSFVAHPIIKADMIRTLSLMNIERIEMMQVVLPEIVRTEGDKSYIEAFIAVGSVKTLQPRQIRKIVKSLNALLDDYNLLKQQRGVLTKVIGTQSSHSLSQQHQAVERQLLKTTDAILKRTLEQNRSILESQLADMDALELNKNRITSQQKVIVSSMNSIKLTLGRAEAASIILNAPDIERISESTTQITNETRALESAIKEVMILNVRG
jgi:hypothetical protein